MYLFYLAWMKETLSYLKEIDFYNLSRVTTHDRIDTLTHLCLVSNKRDTGKQCRPDQMPKKIQNFLQNIVIIITNPYIGNETVQRIEVVKSAQMG